MSFFPPRTIVTPCGGILIRCAQPGDEAAYTAFLLAFDETTPHIVTLPHERDLTFEGIRGRILQHQLDEGRLMLLAFADGAAVADLTFAAMKPERMRHHGYFGIGVDARFRGRGIGRAMLTMLMDWARAHPFVEKICLGCFATNEGALRLYREMGFVEVGRKPREFKIAPGVYEDDVQMAIWIKGPLA